MNAENVAVCTTGDLVAQRVMKKRARDRRYHLRHGDRRRLDAKARRLGISPEEYTARLKDACEICGRPRDEPGPHTAGFGLDHNHETGVVRGTLCARCNISLHAFDYHLEAVLAYLARDWSQAASVAA